MNRPTTLRTLIIASSLLLSTCALAQDQAATNLPIQRVVMFNSGVGFFEHTGEVEGNAKVDLKFNVDDVNDLLKSMVLQDLGGGKISTVNYGSKDPITKTLKTFAIDLTTNPTLADLLGQVRGEKVRVTAPNEITGTIVGVEKRTQPVGDKGETITVEMLNLLTDDGLRSVNLANVGSIKLQSAKLDAELRQALAILALGHDVDKKTVTLNFLGEGKRRVRVGYIQETPIWKTSYRLVLKDDEKPFLQGWAIVENTTEADWNNVNLTLVSGRPISFVMDLYQPLYLPRPEVVPELFASLRPQTYDQDLAAAEGEFRKMAEQAGKQRAALAGAPPPPAKADAGDALARRNLAGGFARDKAESREAESFDLGRGVQSVAQAGDVGELFQYKIESPVTLPRQQSAMLPIVNGAVEAEKVSIYNPRVHAKHPLNGLYLTNSTGLHLMQGPITVFDDGAYAGDAQITYLQPGTKRLVSYAMDLGTEVAPASKGEPNQLIDCKLVKGVMHTTYKYLRSQEYTVKNSGAKPKKVLIEQPIDTTWKLVGIEPAEKTRDMYRFAVTAEPGKPAQLVVKEEYTASQQIALTNTDDNTIRFYINAKEVKDDVKKALAEVIRRKQELSQIAAERARLQGQVAVIDQEQARIRQNMAQLDKTSDLYQRYVKKFTEQEDKMDQLRVQIEGQIKLEQDKRADLDKYLISLTVG